MLSRLWHMARSGETHGGGARRRSHVPTTPRSIAATRCSPSWMGSMSTAERRLKSATPSPRGKRIIGYRGDVRLSADNEGAVVNLQVEYFIHESGGRIVRRLDAFRGGFE